MPDCFIIMPITTPTETVPTYGGDADHFKHVLEHLFTPAVEKAGFKAMPPVATGSDLIHASIIRQLEKADLVLCDMSTLNANVFLEFGIRIALNKPVCIVKDEKTLKVPFDAGILHFLEYQSSMAAWILGKQIEDLAAHITASAKGSDGQNTLWKYFGLSTRAELSHGKPSSDDKLDLLRLEVEGLVRKLSEKEVRLEGPTAVSYFLTRANQMGIAALAASLEGKKIILRLRQGIDDDLRTVMAGNDLAHEAEAKGFSLELVRPAK